MNKYWDAREEYRKNAKINWGGLSYRDWSFHICPLDAECRFDDAPRRLNIGTPWGFLYIALWPGHGTQIWLPFKGYIKKCSPISWHPRKPKKRKRDTWRQKSDMNQ